MLRLKGLRPIARLLFEKPIANYETSQPRKVVYSWQENTENNDKFQKWKYVRGAKKKREGDTEQLDFEALKRKITEKAEQEMRGTVKVEEKVVEDDAFTSADMPPVRKYDKIVAKELYYIPRTENLREYNNRKNSYLTEFQEPFEIHDDRVTSLLSAIDKRQTELLGLNIQDIHDPDFIAAEAQKSDAQLVELLTQLRDVIPKTNYRLFPEIALYLGSKLRYKDDFAGVWDAIEAELFKVLHNMSTIELAKLRYGMAGTFPKAGSPRLHKALADLILEDLPTVGASELMHIYHAFRLMRTDKVHTKVLNQLLLRGMVLVKDQPDLLANIVYTYANCRIKKHQRRVLRDPKEEKIEANKILDYFFPELEVAIPNMSTDALVRLTLTLMLARTKQYNDLINKIDRQVRKRAGELDAFQTANFIYAFSKMNDGSMAGKPEFYKELEKNVAKFQKDFNDLEMSRIFYAYTSRGVLSKDLKDKIFLPWVQKNMDIFNYAELANVAYGLMFTESTDKELWRRFARNVSTQKHRCPLVLYAPLKIARHYMSMLFPQWELEHYEDTCFEAERYLNVSRKADEYERDEYYVVTRIIKFDLENVDMKVWVEWENMFIVEYALTDHKFGIVIKKDVDCLPGTNEPKPFYNLKKKILEAAGWSLLEIDWQQFLTLGEQKRIDWLRDEIQKYTEKTKKNAAQDEFDRRMRVIERLGVWDERIWIPGRDPIESKPRTIEETLQDMKKITKEDIEMVGLNKKA